MPFLRPRDLESPTANECLRDIEYVFCNHLTAAAHGDYQSIHARWMKNPDMRVVEDEAFARAFRSFFDELCYFDGLQAMDEELRGVIEFNIEAAYAHIERLYEARRAALPPPTAAVLEAVARAWQSEPLDVWHNRLTSRERQRYVLKYHM
jgi:hypothetical protein